MRSTRRALGPSRLTAASDTDIALTDQHTYPSAGTYYATVTVTDQSGAKVSRTLVETVTNPAPDHDRPEPDVHARRQQPHDNGHGLRFRPRLDRAVGRHP